MTRPVESAAVREEIARALRLDLVGPWAGHRLADERLPGWVRPCNWYLTGFLVPRGAPLGQRGDADVDDEPEVAERAGLGDDSTEDRRAAKKGFFPSSMGLSFLVGEGVETLEVLVRWGDYCRVEAEGGEGGDPDRDGAAPDGEDGETEAGRDRQRQRVAGESGEGVGREAPGEEVRGAAPGEEVRGEGTRTRGEDGGGGAPGEGPADEEAKAAPGTDEASRSQARSWWQRTPRAEAVRVTLPATVGASGRRPVPNLSGQDQPSPPPRPGALAGEPRHSPAPAPDHRPHRSPVPNSGGLVLHTVARPLDSASFTGRIAPGTRSVSVFLVNDRTAAPDRERDEAFAFQAEIEVRGTVPFVPRPDPREVSGDDWDERIADLHYAGIPEYAAGHGVSADWDLADGACRALRTTWTPAAEVEKTETFDPPGVVLDMQALGALADGAAAETALSPLVTGYRSWIEAQRAGLGALAADERRETAERLLHLAGTAADRMERGIRALAGDADALDAFRTANRAVAAALSRRLAREGARPARADGSGAPPEPDGPGGGPSRRLSREGGPDSLDGPSSLGSPDSPDSPATAAPRWRAFQLAFLLLNLPGIANPADPEREIVDLLFFPTGGGKTEAYLGLAAFTMVLRRLRNPGDAGRAGAGVSVVMRYTLRLLTLDQLGRAAGLVCALERERRREEEAAAGRGRGAGRLGEWPFEIGLWVGKAGTPNHLGAKGDGRSDSARAKVNQYKNNPRGKPMPIPLEGCPWCGEDFTPDSFALLPNSDKPTDLRIACADWQCEFSGDRPLPVVAVDEPLYRRLPAFLIATVDKFASLPWVGESGALLGGAERYDAHGFYGAAEPRRGARRLARPLPPPDLVVQDELHLISGPLGTMAGLYETVIESLCVREVGGEGNGESGGDGSGDGSGDGNGEGDRETGIAGKGGGRRVKPKIVASTATVRHAREQIQALFARPATHVFPPPGPERRDSYFARAMPASERSARRYFGVAAQGRNPKEAMRRVLLALMGAAERAWRDAGRARNRDNPADPYMTVLGYFNSLRELGGARRILEEEVQNTLKRYGDRRRLGESVSEGLFRDRTSFSDVVELTSRVGTGKVAEARTRLDRTFHDRAQRVDCAIATNMISVGLDIRRLGLMLVYGQPKTHSEYIQATSRVGRDDRRPGLVVTLYNVHKPRDRSHYERFRHYHETFYRSVEVSSVTPFAARALDRGFAGALVALARHARPAMTPPEGAGSIEAERAALEARLLDAFEARLREQPFGDDTERAERLRSVRGRVADLLDSWRAICEDYRRDGVPMQYQRHEASTRQPLLREMLDTDFESPHHRKFRANRSLRDVEPQVNLFLGDLPSRLGGGGGGSGSAGGA